MTNFLELLSFNYDDFIRYYYNNKNLFYYYNNYRENILFYLALYGEIDKFIALNNMFEINLNDLHNKNGCNLLFYSIYGNKDIYFKNYLIKNNVNPLSKNNFGEYVMHYIQSEEDYVYFDYLLYRNKFDITELKDKKGNNILHTTYKYNLNIKNFLFKDDNFKKLNVKNNLGQLPEEIKEVKVNFCI